METLKTTARWGVCTFVLVAGAVTFAGLDPAAKAEAEAIAIEPQLESKLQQQADAKSLSSATKKIRVSGDANSTG